MKTKTMVYLERAQHRALRERARAEGISLAALIRRLADEHLNDTRSRAVPAATFRALVALGESGQIDIATEHDAHLARALRRKHAR